MANYDLSEITSENFLDFETCFNNFMQTIDNSPSINSQEQIIDANILNIANVDNAETTENVDKLNNLKNIDKTTNMTNTSKDNPYVGTRLSFEDYSENAYKQLMVKCNYTNNCCIVVDEQGYVIQYIDNRKNISNAIDNTIMPQNSQSNGSLETNTSINNVDTQEMNKQIELDIQKLQQDDISLARTINKLAEKLSVISNLMVQREEEYNSTFNKIQEDILKCQSKYNNVTIE